MNPILIGAVIVVGLIALYLLVFRRTSVPRKRGRPDELDPPELTGPEQHKKRELP
jgi:hypothetical protein